MKYVIVSTCLAAIAILPVSCKKDARKVDAANAGIIGTWELRQAQTGMIPTKDYPAGNGNIYKFSESGYEKFANGNLVKTGTYDLIIDNTVEAEVGLALPFGEFARRIIFDDDLSGRKIFIEIADKKITFLSGYFPLDGGSNIWYERISKTP